MQIVLRPRCCPAVAMSRKAFYLQISSLEHKNRQMLTSILYRCFLVNQKIQSLLLAQTQDFQFPFAYHRKGVESVDKKSLSCQTLVEIFQFLANCKKDAIFQFQKDQPMN